MPSVEPFRDPIVVLIDNEETGGSFGQSSLLGLDVLDCCLNRCRVGVWRRCRNGNGRRSAPILGGDRAVCDRPDRRPLEARRLAARGNLIQAGGAAHVPPACKLNEKCFEPDAFKLVASFRQKRPNVMRFDRQFCCRCYLARSSLKCSCSRAHIQASARLYSPPLVPFAERTTRPARRVLHWLWIRMPKQNGVTSPDIAAAETNPDVGHGCRMSLDCV